MKKQEVDSSLYDRTSHAKKRLTEFMVHQQFFASQLRKTNEMDNHCEVRYNIYFSLFNQHDKYTHNSVEF